MKMPVQAERWSADQTSEGLAERDINANPAVPPRWIERRAKIDPDGTERSLIPHPDADADFCAA